MSCPGVCEWCNRPGMLKKHKTTNGVIKWICVEFDGQRNTRRPCDADELQAWHEGKGKGKTKGDKGSTNNEDGEEEEVMDFQAICNDLFCRG